MKLQIMMLGCTFVGTLMTQTTALAEDVSIAVNVTATIENNIAWWDVSNWGVEGRGWTNGLLHFYDRLPAEAEKTVPPAVWQLSRESAGMSARFITDARSIRVRYSLSSKDLNHGWGDMPNMSASGVDLYAKVQDPATGLMRWRWVGGNKPTTQTGEYCLAADLVAGKRLYVLNLPLNNGVDKLEIGVPAGSAFEPVLPRKSLPIVFYGTSIMQGGIASRPGLSIPAIIGRYFDCPILNYGFCGSARMEKEVVDLIAEHDAAAYVIDCEPNMTATDVSQRTEPLIQRLRKDHPVTPILLVEDHDLPSPELFEKGNSSINAKQAALRVVYEKLTAAGDKHLHYLPGRDLIGTDSEGTGDGVHPNALGMFRYGEAYKTALLEILGKPSTDKFK